MDISVVLATYDRDETLARTLASFADQAVSGLRWQVFVVDNACREKTRELSESFQGTLPIQYLRQSTPGKNHALLTAMPLVKGALVVFTDDDIVADPSWLMELWQASQRLHDHDLFGGRILPLFPTGRTPEEGIDLSQGFTRAAYVIADWDLPEGDIRPGRIWGPNMAVRRRVFDSGISFDPTIGPSQSKTYTMGSETEFLLRAAKAGFKSAYVPKALVQHQIRPNQLSIEWLKGRAFRQGKGKAAMYREFDHYKRLFGVPRFLYRKLATLRLVTAYYRITGDKGRYYRNTVELGMYQGIHEFYRELAVAESAANRR